MWAYEAIRYEEHLPLLAPRQDRAGAGAVLVSAIQMDADRFDVARDIDPAYDAAFAAALAAGVESYAYTCRVTTEEIAIEREVEVVTPPSLRAARNRLRSAG
jgi:sugar fermentation stimulation protein A